MTNKSVENSGNMENKDQMDISLTKKAIEEWLAEKEIEYTESANTADKVKLKFDIPLDCRLTKTSVEAIINEDGYRLLAYLPINATLEYRDRIIKFITLINNDIKYGDFEAYYADNTEKSEDEDGSGFVNFKLAIPFKKNSDLTKEMIEDSIIRSKEVICQYGDAFAKLLLGFSSPEEEYKMLSR